MNEMITIKKINLLRIGVVTIVVSILLSLIYIASPINNLIFADSISEFEEDCLATGFSNSYCTSITDFVFDGHGCDSGGFSVYDEVPGCFIIPDGSGGGRYCSSSTNDLIAFTDSDDFYERIIVDRGLTTIGNTQGPDEILCDPLVQNILNEDFDDGFNSPFFIDSEYTSEEVSPDESDCSDGTSSGVWGSTEGEAIRPENGSGGFLLNIDVSGSINRCATNVGDSIGAELIFAGENLPFASSVIPVGTNGTFNETLTFSIDQARAETLQITGGKIGVNLEIIESGLIIGSAGSNNTRGILMDIVDEASADDDTDIEDALDRPENEVTGVSSDGDDSDQNNSSLTNQPQANGAEACLQTGGSVSAENVQACLNCVGNGGIYIAIGCVDPTPIGITTRLIQIALGTMGGVALIQMIVAGIQYQTGDEEKIAEARQKILTTIGGIALLVFSVLLIQILGVDILDVLPNGSV